jgi:hypothetical protein
MPTIRGQKIRESRVIQRDQLFPDSAGKVWTLSRKGYNPVPRVLPLMYHLFGDKEQGNPSRVYFELWCRSFDVGFVEIRSEEESAYSSGYSGPRAVRTWRAHVAKLQQMGFIEVAARGNLKNGFILLHDPFHLVAQMLRKGALDQYWFAAFHARCLEVGTTMPRALTEAIRINSARKKKAAAKRSNLS